jgi:hypothetical protein
VRIWHYKFLPYLPELQFKGQLRELVAIKRDWETKGTTNHLLINRVMEYPKSELLLYFELYASIYALKYNKLLSKHYYEEFREFAYGSKLSFNPNVELFDGWHTKEYLRSNMANLWEKHTMGVGKSRITDAEWQRLCEGYKTITREEYKL